MKLELIRKGEFPGKTIVNSRTVATRVQFGDKELKEIIETFDPQSWKPPIVLGHTSAQDDKAPQFGRIAKIWQEDNSLWGEVEDPAPELPQLLKNYYPHRSVGLKVVNGKLVLDHVALLGAVPPAIKGLRYELNEAKQVDIIATIELAASQPPKLEELPIAENTPWDANGARRRIAEKYGWHGLKEYSLYYDLDACATKENGLAACQDAYKFLIVDIVNGKPHIVPQALKAALGYLHGARGVEIADKVKKKVLERLKPFYKKVFGKDIEERQEASMANEGQIIQLTKEEYDALLQAKEEAERIKRESELEKKKLELSKFIDKLKQEGKITPAMSDGLMEFMLMLSESEQGIIWLSESERHEMSLLEYFKRFMEKMPKIVELNEITGEDESTQDEYAKLGKEIASTLRRDK